MFLSLRHFFLPHESNNQRAKLLHPGGLIGAMLLLLVFQLGLTSLARIKPQILGYASQISPREIIRLTNIRREAQGLGGVVLDEQLSAAAAKKAQDMFARDYWAHVSPIGTQPWAFISSAGYNYRYAGENLARDFTNAPAVVQAWMDSPTHRDNLLNSKYQDIGVAVVDGKLGGHETTLVVQMFGTRLSAVSKPETSGLSVVKTVQAAQVAPTTSITPVKVNPFNATKAISIGVISLFALILIVDLVLIERRKVLRWTSKSFAHLSLMLFLLIASIMVGIGRIL